MARAGLLVGCLTSLLMVSTGCKADAGDDPSSSEDQKSPNKTVSAGVPDDESSAGTGGSKDDGPQTATPPSSWVDSRVNKAHERLAGSEAGQIVKKALDAHGGLKRWFENGPLHFRYDYRPTDDERTRRHTVQTVDTWRSIARLETADNPDHTYGWDGERAWYHPDDWEPPYDVRFWALTPYYFVAMPFVLADPDVNLSLEAPDTILDHPCHVVRVTFGDVGIAPDDYYVVYIDRDTHKLRALRYVVSYPEYFPDGGHSPEKLMTYEGRQTVDGIVFSKKSRFFMWAPEKKTDADVVTRAELDDIEFRPDTELSYFDAPDGAKFVEPSKKNDSSEKDESSEE